MNGITLTAIFEAARTTKDGGWNVTFSVAQDEAQSVMQLALLQNSLLQLAVIPIDPDMQREGL